MPYQIGTICSKKRKLFLNRHSILDQQTSYPIQKLLQQNTLSYILRLIEIKWEKTVNYQFNCNPDIVLSVAFFEYKDLDYKKRKKMQFSASIAW